ncbi:MAG: hypothetical protein DHS20C15_32440 [Planctomycetota bacterium]|nr:MAG: hypothetical protein DHS20C15_32440 [Planctomycetota bacterium]
MIRTDLSAGARRLALACAALLVAACGSTAPSRFYVLTPTAGSELGASSALGAVALAPVVLPRSVDRSQIVTRRASNEVSLAEFARWAEPLEENVARVIEQNLEARLGESSVFDSDSRWGPDAAFIVAVVVQEFDAVIDGACTLVARLHVSDGAGTWLATRSVRAQNTSSESGAAGVAQAMSANLHELSERIVATLQELHAGG